MKDIPVYVINGFIGSGKTTYINKAIAKDFFYKRGSTLILSFEQGEQEYDCQMLQKHNTSIEYYEGGQSVAAFCEKMIEQYQPDRLYLETNCMMEELWPVINDFKVVFCLCFISGESLEMLYRSLRNYLSRMVADANMVIFNRCEKEELAAYATTFQLLNPKADYLWQSAMGYSEQAFGIILPFDLNQQHFDIDETIYPNWYLDGLDNPDHYQDREMEFDCQLRIEQYKDETIYRLGRLVMTCCLADISFLGFKVSYPENEGFLKDCHDGIWLHVVTKGDIVVDKYRQSSLQLKIVKLEKIAPCENKVIGITY